MEDIETGITSINIKLASLPTPHSVSLTPVISRDNDSFSAMDQGKEIYNYKSWNKFVNIIKIISLNTFT